MAASVIISHMVQVNEWEEKLARMVSQADAMDAAVFNLTEAGLSGAEIARRLGVSRSMVSQRLARYRKHHQLPAVS